jgi:peptidoglycan/xylan/chitin deacetylase (PgdA/CDA1 family)
VTFKDIANGKVVPKPIILTFDDGTANQFYAFESLKKRNMVGVFFIVLNYIGKGKHLKEDQLRKMAACGMEIGSHGITHCYLTKVSAKRMEAEILQSKVVMEDMLKTQIITFCYPFGKYNNAILKVMEKSDYVYGRTTNEGVSVFGRGRNLELKVIYIHNNTRNLGKEIK